jgi:hypothetical protein
VVLLARFARAFALVVEDDRVYPEFDRAEYLSQAADSTLLKLCYAQADSICLYSVLRLSRPHRVVEIGSGFTSALML